ncbi:MAG: DUF1127 domain-containing protein [Rhodospirillaceae bacterium]|nr:DUF1127 domain-containing protein [Rhodospirillaceae bacterium]
MTTRHATLHHHHATHSAGSILRDGLARVFGAFDVWQERAQMRRGLATMDDRLLRDIGLTRADVKQELGKPFWRK